jgi:hypothetical protein
MNWSYGITTVRSRISTYLPTTLNSLRNAGFDKPLLFVDGDEDCQAWKRFGLDTTIRSRQLATAPSWILAAREIYERSPKADIYAVFQDDFIAYKNLRQYLEQCGRPDEGYMNLYTFPANEGFFPHVGKTKRRVEGWRMTSQRGLGAVALVFPRHVFRHVLTSTYMYDRSLDPNRGPRAVDGGIVSCLKGSPYREYVHNPSLVQHIGVRSSMGNDRQALSRWWLGEDFDATQLLIPIEQRGSPPNKVSIPIAAKYGLGDKLEQALTFVGVTSDRVESWLGRPCNCNVRKEKLNKLGAWIHQALFGKLDKDEAARQLTELTK